VAFSGTSESAFSATATAQTGATTTAQTGATNDGLSIQPIVMTVAPKQPFSGVVATFADTNVLTPPGSFVATIRWGDGHSSRGTVTGSNGQFTVVGRHRFPAAGRYTVRVAVTMSAPSGSPARTSTTSTAAVRVPLHVVKRAAKLGAALLRSRRGKRA
jgi:hypothetical protein